MKKLQKEKKKWLSLHLFLNFCFQFTLEFMQQLLGTAVNWRLSAKCVSLFNSISLHMLQQTSKHFPMFLNI